MKLRKNQIISPKNLTISYLGILKFLGRKSDELIFMRQPWSLVSNF